MRPWTVTVRSRPRPRAAGRLGCHGRHATRRRAADTQAAIGRRFEYCRGRERAAPGQPPAARGADRRRRRPARLRRRGAAGHRQGLAAKRPTSNGSQRAPIPDSEAGRRCPAAAATMQLTDGEIRATGTNVSGYSLFRVAVDAADRRRRAGRRRPHPLLGQGRPDGPKSPRPRAACARPTRAPRKPGSTARKCRKRC